MNAPNGLDKDGAVQAPAAACARVGGLRIQSNALLAQVMQVYPACEYEPGETGGAILRALNGAGNHSEFKLLALVDKTYLYWEKTRTLADWVAGGAFFEVDLVSGRLSSTGWMSALGYDNPGHRSFAQWLGMICPDDLKLLLAQINMHGKSGREVFEEELRFRTAKGGWCWFAVRGLIVARNDAGNAERILIFMRNIDKRRRLEETLTKAKDAAELANKMKGEFVATVSHELRTPLGGVIGMADLALDTDLDEEQRHYVQSAKHSAEALLSIINDILDFSKIDSGKMVLDQTRFSLHDLVLESARLLAVGAHEKGLELIVDIDRDVPKFVIGDPTRLRQIIVNLLGNALKFTPKGEIGVRVACLAIEQQRALLEISVRDTGVGIPPEKQKLIFESFAQADSSTTRQYGGTGLGLSISARLAGLMQGGIDVRSTPGQGATFIVKLVLGLEGASAQTSVGQLTRFQGKRALVLAENLSLGRAMAGCLETLGVMATCLPSAELAWAVIPDERRGMDYLFVDVGLLKDKAFDLLGLWRGDDAKDGIVVLLPTKGRHDFLERIKGVGGIAHLVKPFGSDDVRDVLMSFAGAASRETKASFLDDFEIDALQATPATPLEILLVEDNPINQEMVVGYLKKTDDRVSIAQNGQEALDRHEQKHFDVILMDLRMPVMGGIEATEEIRSRELRRSWVNLAEKRLSTAYIIAMTANAAESDRQQCLAAGMDDYVSKPIRKELLYAALDRARSQISRAPADEDIGLAPMMPVPAMRPDSAVVDLDAALNNIGDIELLKKMAGMFVADRERLQGGLRRAVAEQDIADLEIASHTLKGHFALFCAPTARDLAARLESLATGSANLDWAAVQRAADQVDGEMAKVMEGLKAFLHGAGR